MDINLINRIKELREEFGWSQRDLAQKTGISPGGISHIESGRNDPTASTLKALAKAFGCGVDYLLGLEDERKAYSANDMKYDEIKLLEYYRLLSPKNKENIFYVLEMGTKGSKPLPYDQIKESIYAN